MAIKIYSCTAIQTLLELAKKNGYEKKDFADGCLGYGSFVLIAPECKIPGKINYHVVVEEVYINEWSSGHKVRNTRKISKAIQRKIDKYERESGWV